MLSVTSSDTVSLVGAGEGIEVEGEGVGIDVDGAGLGAKLGLGEGIDEDGAELGTALGLGVGAGLGRGVGAKTGAAVGLPGVAVGAGVGFGVGEGVGGKDVGFCVGGAEPGVGSSSGIGSCVGDTTVKTVGTERLAVARLAKTDARPALSAATAMALSMESVVAAFMFDAMLSAASFDAVSKTYVTSRDETSSRRRRRLLPDANSSMSDCSSTPATSASAVRKTPSFAVASSTVIPAKEAIPDTSNVSLASRGDDGLPVGAGEVDEVVGDRVGVSVGSIVGTRLVGSAVGKCVGVSVGSVEGFDVAVGATVGEP